MKGKMKKSLRTKIVCLVVVSSFFSQVEQTIISASSCRDNGRRFSCCKKDAIGTLEIVDTKYATIGTVDLTTCTLLNKKPRYPNYEIDVPRGIPCTCIHFNVYGITNEKSLLCRDETNLEVTINFKGCSSLEQGCSNPREGSIIQRTTVQSAPYEFNTLSMVLSADTDSRHVIFKRKAQTDNYFTYETKFFTQKLDHFSFGSNATFQQRYLISTEHWDGPGAPIFLYTGNQNSIEWFCNVSGFIWDIAPQFGAIVIFAEHRYYGESMPFGNQTYKDYKNLRYLTSEQALADFAVLVRHIKRTTEGARKSPVIAFGGSYGGMLAAWFRLKYPNLVTGALASSAPIWSFLDNADCNGFMRALTRTFNKTSTNCVVNIRRLWSTIDTVANKTDGLSYMSTTFRLCKALYGTTDVRKLKDWINEAIKYIGVIDYPYPTIFFQPFTAWPVKEFCKPIDDPGLTGRSLIEAAAESMKYFLNSTGETKCMKIGSAVNKGWNYQTCTEMVHPFCTDGVQDMFEPSSWNFTEFSEACYSKYGVRPDPYWLDIEYWGKKLKSASNIIFSNGLLDPWSSGGVLESQSSSVISIVIPSGSHHLDLRSAHAKDPEDVRQARKRIIKIVKKWIDEADMTRDQVTGSAEKPDNAKPVYILMMSVLTLFTKFWISLWSYTFFSL